MTDDERSDKLLLSLAEYVEACGGSQSMLNGWCETDPALQRPDASQRGRWPGASAGSGAHLDRLRRLPCPGTLNPRCARRALPPARTTHTSSRRKASASNHTHPRPRPYPSLRHRPRPGNKFRSRAEVARYLALESAPAPRSTTSNQITNLTSNPTGNPTATRSGGVSGAGGGMGGMISLEPLDEVGLAPVTSGGAAEDAGVGTVRQRMPAGFQPSGATLPSHSKDLPPYP